jgi:UDP-N-acetylenolpyruvoylglucosamine reductase
MPFGDILKFSAVIDLLALILVVSLDTRPKSNTFLSEVFNKINHILKKKSKFTLRTSPFKNKQGVHFHVSVILEVFFNVATYF